MLIAKDTNLRDFNFWSGASDTVKELTTEQLNELEYSLEDVYPSGIDATHLNDIFWFERDMLAEWLGYENWETLIKDR